MDSTCSLSLPIHDKRQKICLWPWHCSNKTLNGSTMVTSLRELSGLHRFGCFAVRKLPLTKHLCLWQSHWRWSSSETRLLKLDPVIDPHVHSNCQRSNWDSHSSWRHAAANFAGQLRNSLPTIFLVVRRFSLHISGSPLLAVGCALKPVQPWLPGTHSLH